MTQRTPGALVRVIALALLAATSASAACTRENLLAAAKAYVEAQTAGKIDTFKRSSNFTYMENNKKVDPARALLSKALKVDLSRSTADTVDCATYTMMISATGTPPYVIGTQLRFDGEDTTSVALVDTIFATTGDLFFNAPKTLSLIQAEKWTDLEASRRPTRELLKKVGDGYLDMWTDRNAADSIPWGTDCERVEGSQYTRPCGGALPRGGSAKKNGNRRYVIDDVVGSVDVLCSFDSLGNMPDSHEIRVEDGKVKYVHTITAID